MKSVSLQFPPDVSERERQIISFVVNSHYTVLCHVQDVMPGATPEARQRVLDALVEKVRSSFPGVVAQVVDPEEP
jgi:hypothetical protein